MRAVVQRVKGTRVMVSDKITGQIDMGLLVYLGVEKDDNDKDLEYILDKVVNLRVFVDEDDKMNLSLSEVNGQVLVISQFTLYGDCRKGRRPSFSNAAQLHKAQDYYNRFIKAIKEKGIHTEAGVFRAHMEVESINHGPVTILLDSRKAF